MNRHDFLISYSRKDLDQVSAFVDMLKQRIPTIDVWMDLKGIEAADEFDEENCPSLLNTLVARHF